MKKYIIITAAALVAMCACTKNEVNVPSQEIAFQTVNYVGQTKALEGSAFTYDHFGVFAWSKAAAGKYYMDNETVTLQGGEWKAQGTYYWPKDANVDFISYYPRENVGGYITVDEAKISYKDFNAAKNQVDLLYADKVVGYGYADNADGSGVTDGANTYKTVPAFFRHALAQLNIQAKLAYRSKTNYLEDGKTVKDSYRWEIEITDAKLIGINTVGSLDLTLSGTENPELAKTYPWVKPANELWTSGTPADVALGKGAVTTDASGCVLLNSYYVIPQALADQAVELTFNIKTYRGVGDAEPSLFLNEKDVKRTVKLSLAKDVTAWKINQATTYVFVIAPTAGNDNPEDPDDPDLDDVELTFDPAVKGWDPEVVGATISL